VIGVPQFWLQVLKNFDNVAEMIQEHDEPISQHLIDIECLVQVEPPVSPRYSKGEGKTGIGR
jgi:hypothetical protein